MVTDSYLRKLVRKIGELEAQETSLRTELVEVAQRRARYQAAREVYEEMQGGEIARTPRKSKRAKKTGQLTYGDRAERVLIEFDRPVRTRELMEGLKIDGGPWGENAYSTVVKTLIRDSRFVNAGKGLWDLAQRQQQKPTLFAAVNGASSSVEAPDVERSQVR